jgi:CSLREA domain-containing protein
MNGGAGGNGGSGGVGGAAGAASGGGLDRRWGSVSLRNATVADNQAASGAGGSGGAGGAAGPGGAGGTGREAPNGASGPNGLAGAVGGAGATGASMGGGLSANSGAVYPNHVLLHNTIVARNTAGGAASDISGAVEPLSSHNLIGTGGAGGLADGSDGNLVDVADPRLGTLADNGGPTQTLALLRGSPAVDAGIRNASTDLDGFFLTTDQRGTGFPRSLGFRVDIGAFESPYGPESLVVTTLADEDDGTSNSAAGSGTSLREAIAWANLHPGADTITFAPALAGGVIILGGTQLPVITDSLTITAPAAGVTISGNDASRVLEIAAGAHLDLVRLTITRGSAFDGGGIYNSGTLTMTSSTLSENRALGSLTSFGGGIYNRGTLAVTSSTLADNSARNGAGIYNDSTGTLTVTNCTFAENSTGLSNAGGGIYNGGAGTLTNSTLYGNSGAIAGGIRNMGTVTLTNTIVAGHSIDLGGDRGVTAASAFNVIGNAGSAGGLVHGVNGNIVGVDPRLGPLADNGGPTQTHALLPFSPAINAGSNALVPAGVTTDQRGAFRFRAGTVDIGAFEVPNDPPTIGSFQPAVTTFEGSLATNSGFFEDDPAPPGTVQGPTVTLTASLGTLTVEYGEFGNSWFWSYVPPDGPSGPTTVTITATDNWGATATTTFTLTVNNVPPTITEFSVPATAAEGDTVTVSAVAIDPGDDLLTYTWLITDPNGNSNRWNGASISLVMTDDGTYNFYLQVSDGDGSADVRQAQIVVTNVRPTIAISGAATVNTGAAYTLNLGAVTDPGDDTVTHYVVHWGDGSSDTYTTGGDKTHVYATGAATYAITVDLIDEDGTHLDRANPLSVYVNAAPTDIGLSKTSIAENQPVGTTVGSFSTTDPDSGDSHTYTLVAGAGADDNGSFTIDAAGNLKTSAMFDFETKSSYSIRVRSTDAGGLSVEQVFVIGVTNVNEGPTNIGLSNTSVAENQPAGTVIGTFSTTDLDSGDSHTYSLVAGAGADDNASFTIDAGGNLKTSAMFDFETKSSYSISVRSTDAGGLSVEKVFVIGVTDVNEAPTLVVPAAQTAYEDVDLAITGLTVGDPDSDDLTVTLTVTRGKLTLGTTAGLAVVGNGASTVTLSGSIVDLNAALANLVYRGNPNDSGADTLNITVSDGNQSTGGNVALTIKSAVQQAADIQAEVTGLQTAGVLSKVQARKLLQVLNVKGKQSDQGSVSKFLRQVAKLLAEGVLTQKQADALLGLGNTLLLGVSRR